MKRSGLNILLAAILLAAAGCTPQADVVCPDPKLAAPLPAVIAYHNANATLVPRLWSYAKVAITLRDKPSDLGVTWGSTSPLAETNARLFLTRQADPLAPPDFILLIKEAGQDVGRVGISTHDGVYYSWMNLGDNRQVLYGQLALAGAPGITDMPIDPTQLPAVLGIMPLPTDLSQPPTVLQTYSTDPCAYVLSVIDRQPVTGRLLLKREMYFDRRAEVIESLAPELGSETDPSRFGRFGTSKRSGFSPKGPPSAGTKAVTEIPHSCRLIFSGDPILDGSGAMPAYLDENSRSLKPYPPRLVMTKIYDATGRLVLTAETSDYQPITLADMPDAIDPPVMPTDIKLTWHETGSEMRLRLSGMTTADKLVPEAYYFWERLPAALRPLAQPVDRHLQAPTN